MQSLYLIGVLITVLSVAWLALCVGMWRLHRSRTQPKLVANTKTLIVYASQTGNAQSIAQYFADALSVLEKVSAIPLNALTFEHLLPLEKVLFVISTYGDGEAPDNGSLFTKLLTTISTSTSDRNADINQLNHLAYSVVALGDSTYPEFCAFGYQVDQAMKDAGAKQLSKVITVDNYDELITNLADITPDWLEVSQQSLIQQPSLIKTTGTQVVKSKQYWQLIQRELLNPDCNDEPLLQITFKSIGPSPTWQAGDLIEIQPKQPSEVVDKWLAENNINGDIWLTHQGHQQSLKAWLLERELPETHKHSANELLQALPYLHKRSYSIASIPEDGQLQLIVRLFEKHNGDVQRQAEKQEFGLASGFLSHYCQVGDVIDGHIKSVNSHHNIDHSKPIILIGAGSGLAGLKAQISARFYLANQQDKSIGQSWLIFGERNNKAELPINKQLAEFEKEPVKVNKLSCAFSQDSQYPKYVQNVLFNEQDKLHQWIDDGAYIYVCGSLVGMGEGVQDALVTILGQEKIEELQQQQRYIRDVY
ncbi:hypothetical protein GCM10008107_13170 [Psychrosphaera saromensis]|uniref:NADPH--hemoprotein reductase n=1 Tax=Psychrosphaera saromensis TaxID=716813 RepID=A0A2S7UVZ4_9GAMM|nr:flavodoxin domain-containing protein [Psychrosphaera saromensis]PQJ53441.1 hypothetical protein BTO11_07005 [Psychrosphaera saromensis]GHB65513.1 hypothetical protein GCM10008107_13170 [Psychrosphaera saromensis]GLQ14773.1 hypothetical protein GCM10007917_22280 [Psychrosphaera saromensis]